MVNSNYLIREATVSDLAALVDFGVSVSHDTYIKTGFLPAEYVNGPQRTYWEAAYLENVILQEQSLLLVVFDGETLIGMTEVEKLGREEAVMWKLYFQKAYQGQGLGSRLLQEILRRLSPDIRRLKTEYYDSNLPAARFYAANGFAFLERQSEQFGEHQIPYTYVVKTIGD